jgi:SNF2 family DNA or RNA helicase
VLDLRDSPVLRETWDVVVLDEASRIKNRESSVAMACMRLPRKRRWALTGTPMENRREDLLPLLDFLTGEPGRRARVSATMSGLKEQLHELQLRRKKEEVLTELPPKQVNEVVIELRPAQRAAYDRAEQDGLFRLQEAGAAVTITHVLELIARLKQLCNIEPVSGESAKLADISERLDTLVEEGHRALVFSQFTDDTFGIARAAEYLKEFQPLQFTGSLSANQKAVIVQRFLSEPRHKALLLSLRSGGVGLNLQAASYVFHLDRWWNPAIEDQADSRAHRMGQIYPVTVFRYICANTIEERIDRKLRDKRALFHEIIDDVSLDIASALNEKDLFGLFGLPSPPRPSPRAAAD